jgi:hypothetical protein
MDGLFVNWLPYLPSEDHPSAPSAAGRMIHGSTTPARRSLESGSGSGRLPQKPRHSASRLLISWVFTLVADRSCPVIFARLPEFNPGSIATSKITWPSPPLPTVTFTRNFKVRWAVIPVSSHLFETGFQCGIQFPKKRVRLVIDLHLGWFWQRASC